MYHHHRICRACGYGPKPTAPGIKSLSSSERLIEVMDLGVQPLANDFQDENGNFSGFAPLKVLFCPRCTLAQLSVVVRPDILYSNYSYITSASQTMLDHFGNLWADIKKASPAKSVLEIGSNTGDFLEFCSENGADNVLGIDPAENLCAIARNEKHVSTIDEVFSHDSAMKANWLLGGCDVVVARHVFCHIDNWKGFIQNLMVVGDKDTLYCIEVPYAVDMLKMNSWDQIYHEHLSFLTIRAMDCLLAETGLHIDNVKRYAVHGGTIVLFLRRDEWACPDWQSNWPELKSEEVTAETWQEFAKIAEENQMRLSATIDVLLAQGKSVVGFGASAKSTVWINACGFGRNQLRFVCDNTPQKQWKFIPGTEIPVVDEGALLRELPDYAVCFAWNFLPEIMQRQSLYLNKGGRFIVPVPSVTIVPKP